LPLLNVTVVELSLTLAIEAVPLVTIQTPQLKPTSPTAEMAVATPGSTVSAPAGFGVPPTAVIVNM
jgi:hypothetical protein